MIAYQLDIISNISTNTWKACMIWCDKPKDREGVICNCSWCVLCLIYCFLQQFFFVGKGILPSPPILFSLLPSRFSLYSPGYSSFWHTSKCLQVKLTKGMKLPFTYFVNHLQQHDFSIYIFKWKSPNLNLLRFGQLLSKEYFLVFEE